MSIDASLYKLNKDAFDIIADAYDRLTDLASAAIDFDGARRQPLLIDRLVLVGLCYEQVMEHLILNEAVTEIVGITGENVTVVNQLLIQLKTLIDKPI